jgi:hypothetical protein
MIFSCVLSAPWLQDYFALSNQTINFEIALLAVSQSGRTKIVAV